MIRALLASSGGSVRVMRFRYGGLGEKGLTRLYRRGKGANPRK